jgi:hypothetical protein
MVSRRKRNLLWLLLLVAIVVAVGAAFTASNTFGATAGYKLGYGAQTVTGANVTSMHYTLNGSGVLVDTVTFIADGDLTLGVPQEHGYVGFTVAGVPGAKVDCGVGVYAAGPNQTTFICDVTPLAQTVALIEATDIAVAD